MYCKHKDGNKNFELLNNLNSNDIDAYKKIFSFDDAGNPKYISYYDKENKRKKQIDLDKPHMGVSPHTHHGYNHRENDSPKGFANLDVKERNMGERINTIWKEKGYARWKRWKTSR